MYQNILLALPGFHESMGLEVMSYKLYSDSASHKPKTGLLDIYSLLLCSKGWAKLVSRPDISVPGGIYRAVHRLKPNLLSVDRQSKFRYDLILPKLYGKRRIKDLPLQLSNSGRILDIAPLHGVRVVGYTFL